MDGTLNQQGAITRAAVLHMEMPKFNHKEIIELAVTNTGRHDILLGTDWLAAHNPTIDWTKRQLGLFRCPETCSRPKRPDAVQLQTLLPSNQEEKLPPDPDDLLDQDPNHEGIDARQRIMAHLQKFNFQWETYDVATHGIPEGPELARATVSTQLAQKEQPKTVEIPRQYQRYAKVFSDTEAQ